MLLAWVLGGLLALAGALVCRAGSRVPHAGGEYVYLREAFGRFGVSLWVGRLSCQFLWFYCRTGDCAR
jgi:APA family basic amino acid/polyamine antiporter